jgi:quinol monooxygenase YgiN
MFITVLKLIPQPGKKKEIIEILQAVQDQNQLKTSCLDCEIFTPCLEGNWILYLDQWSSKEEIYRHIQSPTFHWMLSAMELASEQPEISFHEVTDTHGMELIERLRLTQR